MPTVREGVGARVWVGATIGLTVSIAGGAAMGSSALGGLNPIYRGWGPDPVAVPVRTVRTDPVEAVLVVPLSSMPGSGSGLGYFDPARGGRAPVWVPDAWERQAAAEERRWQARWDADAARDRARIRADSLRDLHDAGDAPAAPDAAVARAAPQAALAQTALAQTASAQTIPAQTAPVPSPAIEAPADSGDPAPAPVPPTA